MKELHPSFTAVGAHFDQEIEEVLAHRSHKEEQGRPAERELRKGTTAPSEGHHESKLTDLDRQTEEMMRLGQ